MRIFLSLFLLVSTLKAQLPESDIWLYKIKKTATGIILHEGINITDRPGYDNQPCFSADGKILYYVSIREDNQADIYKYQLGNKKIVKFTNTVTSEYSPTLLSDGKLLSVLMVEADSTQRIWSLNADGTVNKLITEKEDSIGYFTWLNKDSVLFYKLTDPHSLHSYSISTGKDIQIADSVIRSFRPATKRKFFYVVRHENANQVRLYDMVLRKSEEYAVVKSEVEDLIWDKTLGLIKSEGSKLMRYNDELKTWLELGDFSAAGIKRITRFAISPNGRFLAIVSNK
jgi:hypothetical protein